MVVVIIADMATTSESVRKLLFHKFFQGYIAAKVVNLPAGHVKHHFYQVFTDVMNIALNTADDDLGIDRSVFLPVCAV
jgi:hypothetical protein